jgi:hypothetical protein
VALGRAAEEIDLVTGEHATIPDTRQKRRSAS